MEPLLAIEGLKTHFFTSSGVVKAVDGVSFSVKRGGRLGIVGESGCGKSVAALSLLRLVAPPGRIVGGRIVMDGTDLLSLPEPQMREVRGGRIAMVFQDAMASLNPVFTIGDQIKESILLHQQVSAREAKGQVVESLRLVGVPDPDRIDRSYPHELSGGMRQRAMIAMALACRPDLLIADEPTTALDVTVQAQVLSLLMEVQVKLNMALILITHDLGIIAETVDEVAVMYAGRIVEQARTADLFFHPRHPYTRALLKSLPKWGRRGRLETIPGAVPDLSRLPQGCVYQDRCEKGTDRCRVQEPDLIGSVRCYYPYD